MAYYGRWKPYVPVSRRREQARRQMEAMKKKGVAIQPVSIAGRKIAQTFWGEAWCDHLESFSDYANRLPRGRTYVRNGSVCHLGIQPGAIEAKVSGSDIYQVKVSIKTLPSEKWNTIKQRCAGQIGSLIELLKGDLSDNIMQVVTDRKNGLFPLSKEITFHCNCPDWASMCKHVAAVLYGVGARLDDDPALLFALRGVNHEELIDMNSQVSVPSGSGRGGSKRLAVGDLGDVFGIDLEPDANAAAEPDPAKRGPSKRGRSKAPSKAIVKTRSVKRKPASAKKTTSGSAKSAPAVKKKTVKKKTAKKKTSKEKSTKKKTASSAKKKSSQRSPFNSGGQSAAATTIG